MDKNLYLKYKEQYISTGEIHPAILREYYNEHNTVKELEMQPSEFEHYFSTYLRYLSSIRPLSNPVLTITKRVMGYFDKKFEIIPEEMRDERELKSH